MKEITLLQYKIFMLFRLFRPKMVGWRGVLGEGKERALTHIYTAPYGFIEFHKKCDGSNIFVAYLTNHKTKESLGLK